MKLLASALSVLFVAIAAASSIIPSVGAAETQITITTDELNAKVVATPTSPGYNVEGTSVFTNLVNANNDGQLFLIRNGVFVYEKPSPEPVKAGFLLWCSDLSFTGIQNNSSSSSSPGYAGRCVLMWLGNTFADLLAAGAQVVSVSASTEDFTSTRGISAVFVEQLNVIEGQMHKNTDDVVFRCWDDGRPSMPFIGWEGHDEGDLSPNAATSALSTVGEFIWTSVEDVAKLLNTTADEFTPDTFKDVYADVWIKEHEQEAAENNPNPEAEEAIIEQVKNETNSNNGGTGGADDSTGGDGTDNLDGNAGTVDLDANNGGTATDEGDPSDTTGRKLASATTRFVSASLRIFGI
mmetsp:Transcript_10332/g.20712  ORF Transcript_10332/g.20712 Transcript_10332/m.20712 type:complete len:351 (+) Transcript_10332:96-1148(+)